MVADEVEMRLLRGLNIVSLFSLAAGHIYC